MSADTPLVGSCRVYSNVAFRAAAVCTFPAQLKGPCWNIFSRLGQIQHSFRRCPNVWLQLAFSVRVLWSDGADGWGPVGERVPLALDAGAVCVEGLADADDVQAGLIGQLGQELWNLQRRFVCDDFFPHVAIYCQKGQQRGSLNDMFIHFLLINLPTVKRIHFWVVRLTNSIETRSGFSLENRSQKQTVLYCPLQCQVWSRHFSSLVMFLSFNMSQIHFIRKTAILIWKCGSIIVKREKILSYLENLDTQWLILEKHNYCKIG